MSLKNQITVTFAADGPIGAAAARAFAHAGATTILAGTHRNRLAQLAAEIGAAGGEVAFAIVDTLDEAAVEAFVATVVAEEGRIDLAFDATAYGDVEEPLTALSPDDFARPLEIAQRSQSLTTRVVAREMIRWGSGTILSFGRLSQNAAAEEPATRVAVDAIVGLRRQWACERGTLGVRAMRLTKRTPLCERRDDSRQQDRSGQGESAKSPRPSRTFAAASRAVVRDARALACRLLAAAASHGSRDFAAT